MKPKIIFFGSDKYSQIVLKALEKDRRFQIVKNLKDKPDVGVLASYGKILPSEILAIPKYGILNIHPSLLPKYRGASPVQAAILAGDKETGVSIIKMDEKVDHGPIVAQFAEKILLTDTAESLYQHLFTSGAEVLLTILPAYLKDQIELRQQNDSQST
ncbi:methionyl-tRNA formyltransferase, partial [Candidatus Shapirobacteria bacterium CG_4_9_14_0_2_um_filter_39_11]